MAARVLGPLSAASLEERAVGMLARMAVDRACLGAVALVALGMIWQTAVAGSEWGGEPFWNDVRLSRAYAAVGGLDLYASPDEGVLPGHLYGPVGFFAYAPVRLASMPGEAIQYGILISWLLVLGPFCWIVAEHCGARPAVLCLLLLATMHFGVSPGAEGIRTIHVDAPATGLVLVSLGAVLRSLSRTRGRALLVLAAFASAAAVWSKQTAALTLVLPAVLCWQAGRRRDAWLVLACTLGSCLLLGVLFGSLYGFGDLWWTMFVVPARHVRYPGVLLTDSAVLLGLLDLLPLAAVVLFLRRGGQSGEFGPARAALLYSAALLPLAVLGRMKIGGAPNNYLAPEVLLTLALCLAAGSALRDENRSLRRPALAVLGLLMAVQVTQTAQGLAFDAYRHWTQPPGRPSDEAYAFLKQHPGRAYFPSNPLAMHMAEGRLYHTGFGAVTRAQAGFPVSERQWRAHIPAEAEWLITPEPLKPELQEQMPEFSVEVKLPELSRWIVFRRASE